MTKPRNSVLYMFDPLQQPPSTPPRGSSPELSQSDKENDAPPGDFTVFFNRFYVAHKEQHPRPLTPKGKLIDIGDTPVPERVWDSTDHDGSDADEELSESDVEACGGVSPPRMPLADLDLDHTPRPPVIGRPLKLSLFPSPSQDYNPIPTCFAPTPLASPLSEVVDSINFSSLTLTEDSAPIPPTNEPKDGRPSSPCPEINVCAPETPIEGDFGVPNADEQIENAPTTAHLRPPSTLTQLSPDDPRRTSVDLYSSFHLHLQSDEMSFDLLNDKISFLGCGQDSFWAGNDAALEFEEMSIPSVMKAKLDQLLPPVEIPTKSPQRQFSPLGHGHAVRSIDWSADRSLITETAMNVPLPLSPVYLVPPSRNVTPPRLELPAPIEPPSPTSPVVADEPSLLLESEPLPPIPQAVPALRIFKKTFKTSRSTDLTSKTGTGKLGTSLKRITSLSTVAAKPAVAPTQPARAPIRGVQRPPVSMQAAGGVVIGLPPRSSASVAGTASSTCTSSLGTNMEARSARAPVSRFAGIQRPNVAAKEKAAPRSTSGGLRFAAPGSIRPPASSAPKAGGAALRPPSRIAVPNSSSSSSALPKPVPRSGPSGIARTASMTATSNSTLTTGGARVRASTFSKAARREP